MKKIPFKMLICFLVLSSCTSVSESDLIEIEPIVDKITYDDHIKVIIDNNCLFCHSNPPVNGAPISLTTYEEVKKGVQINGLISRVSKQAGESGAMPAGGPRLPQNLIDQIIQWNDDGLLENQN